jgi:hypothetical protein
MTWLALPLAFLTVACTLGFVIEHGPEPLRRAFDNWTDRFAGGPIGVAAPDSHVRKLER